MHNEYFIKKVLSQRSQYSVCSLAQKYSLSPQTIMNWIQGKLPQGKRQRSSSRLDLELLMSDIETHRDSFQYERAKRLGVSTKCINYNLKILGITYKKTLMHAKACDEKQLSFQEKVDKHERSGADIVYLDESGHTHSQIRTHGYTKRGKRCIGTHNWGCEDGLM